MKKKILLALMLALVQILYLPMTVHAAGEIPAEITSKGNILFIGESGESEVSFSVSDLFNLRDDFLTCRETAETTRKPMVYALALKGVVIPETASYGEIAEGILRIPDEYVWTGNEPGEITYDYHNHVDSSGTKTNDTGNNAVIDRKGGCYTVPMYHVHAGNPANYGGCYTSPVYHAHIGNPAVYGGCYTSPVYHVHTGSSAAYGGCYIDPVYHVHTGSAAAYGGCYTSPLYHVHTGSQLTGGGCYTVPVFHTHVPDCYQTQQVYCNCAGYSQGEFLGNHIHDGYPIYKCNNCGHQSTDHSGGTGGEKCNKYEEKPVLVCGLTETFVESYDLGCGKDSNTIDGYGLGCGKTANTVESYGLGCGKDSNTVESYDLGCGKTADTIESYDLGCGKTTSTVTGFSLGCNHVENQIIAVHIRYD